DPACVLDHLEAARDLAERVREDLAVLGGEDAGDVLAVLVDELPDAEEELGAAREGDGAPALERLLRSPDGRVDLLDAREVDRARLLAGCGVPDRAAPARGAFDRLPADPVVNGLDLRRRERLSHPALLEQGSASRDKIRPVPETVHCSA